MEILRIEVFTMVDNKLDIRVTGKNDAGQVITGLVNPIDPKNGPKALNDLVKELTEKQTHVSHTPPFGK